MGQYQPNRGGFEDRTTYNNAYEGKQIEKPDMIPHYAYEPNKSHFDEHTTYNDYYKNYEIEKERPSTCQAVYRPNAARFDSHTAYGDVIIQ